MVGDFSQVIRSNDLFAESMISQVLPISAPAPIVAAPVAVPRKVTPNVEPVPTAPNVIDDPKLVKQLRTSNFIIPERTLGEKLPQKASEAVLPDETSTNEPRSVHAAPMVTSTPSNRIDLPLVNSKIEIKVDQVHSSVGKPVAALPDWTETGNTKKRKAFAASEEEEGIPRSVKVPMTAEVAVIPKEVSNLGSSNSNAVLRQSTVLDTLPSVALIKDPDGWLMLDRNELSQRPYKRAASAGTPDSQDDPPAATIEKGIVRACSSNSNNNKPHRRSTPEFEFISYSLNSAVDLTKQYACLGMPGVVKSQRPGNLTRDVRKFKKNYVRISTRELNDQEQHMPEAASFTLNSPDSFPGAGRQCRQRVVLYSIKTMEKVFPGQQEEVTTQLKLVEKQIAF